MIHTIVQVLPAPPDLYLVFDGKISKAQLIGLTEAGGVFPLVLVNYVAYGVAYGMDGFEGAYTSFDEAYEVVRDKYGETTGS